jgi:hypothetical protein
MFTKRPLKIFVDADLLNKEFKGIKTYIQGSLQRVFLKPVQ